MDDNNPNVTQIIHNSLNFMANNPYPFPEKPLLIHNLGLSLGPVYKEVG